MRAAKTLGLSVPPTVLLLGRAKAMHVWRWPTSSAASKVAPLHLLAIATRQRDATTDQKR